MAPKTFAAIISCIIGILLLVAIGVDMVNSTGKTDWLAIALAFVFTGFCIHFFVPASSNPAA